MPDVFISYAATDSSLAQLIGRGCDKFGLSHFLAESSLEPGSKWKEKILENLKSSRVFFFLATASSIESDACKHEIGAALSEDLEIVPIIWEVSPSRLPSWISEYQGIVVRDNDVSGIRERLSGIAKKKQREHMIVGAVSGVLIGMFLASNRNS